MINMSSNVALMGVAGRDCYTAAKGGIAAITRSLAVAYARPHFLRFFSLTRARARDQKDPGNGGIAHSQGEEVALGPQHPQPKPDDEKTGGERQVGLDPLRYEPNRSQRGENAD